jgi:molybdopterin molybdotransferase
MLTVSEALDRLLASLTPLGTERVALEDAWARVLAADLLASHPLPPFDNSAMDGFALRAEDVRAAADTSPVALRVVSDVSAGARGLGVIVRGEAARIMTGALLPDGADAVIPVESTDCPMPMDGQPLPAEVRAVRPVAAGDNVRRAGHDVAMGRVALRAGQRLRPQDIGMLAALGQAEVGVVRRPLVGLLSTGSELVPADRPLGEGQIHDANGPALSAAVRSAGGVVVPLGIAEDDIDAVVGRLDQAVQAGVHLMVTSAGVSMGAYDCVRAVLERHGRIDFWRVHVRPGKPLAFGEYRGMPTLGLPGNPVSAMVAFELFVRPAIDRLQGLKETQRQRLVVRLSEGIKTDGRQSYMRCRVRWAEGELWATLTGPQGSGILSSMVQANALLVIPSEVQRAEPGDRLEAWLLEGASLA